VDSTGLRADWPDVRLIPVAGGGDAAPRLSRGESPDSRFPLSSEKSNTKVCVGCSRRRLVCPAAGQEREQQPVCGCPERDPVRETVSNATTPTLGTKRTKPNASGPTKTTAEDERRKNARPPAKPPWPAALFQVPVL